MDAENNWIDVSDKLPEEAFVLVVDMNHKHPLISLAHYSGSFWWIASKGSDVSGHLDPTHWMPMPQLPKVGN